RPPDVVLPAGADGDVGEGEAGGEVEAEVAGPIVLLRLEEVGERGAGKRCRGRSEMAGERVRDIGQVAIGIGLPEPAAAALLELGDEAAGLVRPPFRPEPAVAT